MDPDKNHSKILKEGNDISLIANDYLGDSQYSLPFFNTLFFLLLIGTNLHFSLGIFLERDIKI